MTELKNNNNSKRNYYYPIILWLFPLFLLNIGWKFYVSIDRRWEEQERVEIADRETESLAINSDFSYCFVSAAGKFCDVFKSDVELFGEISQEGALVSYIKSRSDNIFKSPFPNKSLIVFRLTSNNEQTRIIYTNDDNSIETNNLSDIFEYLVKINQNDLAFSEEKKRKGAEISKQIFGNNLDASIYANSQRSKSSLAYYNNKSFSFLWDYFYDNATNDIFGFFIFVDNAVNTDTVGRLLAIEEYKEKQKDLNKQRLAAFIPLFPGFGDIVASDELKRNPELSSALEKWIPKNKSDLYNWQKNGAPEKPIDCIIGKYQAFFYTAPNQTHSAVLFVPISEEIKMPVGLLIFDIVVLIVIFTLLTRGFLFGKWPDYSLKVRFFTTYFLAACLPLGLMLIASYGYIAEYKHTDIFNNQSKLKLNINRFDNNKIQTQEEYKTAFLEILNNQSVFTALSKLNNTYDNSLNKITPEAMDVLSRMLSILNKGERNLPFISLAIIDEKGGCLHNRGNELNPSYKSLLTNSSDIKTEDVIDSNDKSDLENNIYNSLFDSLLKRIEDTSNYDANNIVPVENDNYEDLSFVSKINDKNTRKIITNNNIKSNSLIFDFISVNQKPRFAICLYWDESSLDEKTFFSALRYLSVNEPYLIFSAYKANSNGIKMWPENVDRHRIDFENSCMDIIKQANFRNNIVVSRDENKSIIAVPSKKYKDVIFVGGVFYDELEMDIFVRFWVCIVVIFIAVIIFFSSLHYSSIIFIKPIRKLKGLLDKISEGNLDIEIKSNSQDEFSLVCNEFSLMTKELLLRRELSTLISDHAVEALSKKEDSDGFSEVEIFKGTVLVSDIRNFTGMCEQYSPNLITELLDKHFAVMTRIISSNGGRIYKYVGDAIEAVFADKDDTDKTSAERAFITGCEMLNCLKEINKDRFRNNLFDYKIGIGLCYGKMSAGTIGNLETRLDYAIIGDSLKEASVLESYSRFKPEFPLIVNKSFVGIFNNTIQEVSFKQLDNSDIEAYEISDEKSVKEYLEKNNIGIDDSKNIINSEISNSKRELETNKSFNIFNIEEKFSFWRKFIPGFLFVTVLAIIFSIGIYFVYTTANNSEKTQLSIANNRNLEQMMCEEYGKTAFDIKCRDISIELQSSFDSCSQNDITEEFVVNKINSIFNTNKIFDGIEVKRLFLMGNSLPDLKNKDTSFIDKVSLKPVANFGFTTNETVNLTNSFKQIISFDSLDNYTKNSGLNKNDSETFLQSCQKYIKDKYLEPSAVVFGNAVDMTVFKDNARNAVIDAVYNGKRHYLYWFDFYKDDKLIGYFLISAPSKQIMESIAFLLNAYSKDDALVVLKNRESKKWYFSDNVPSTIREGIISADRKQSVFDENDMRFIGNEYLYNLLGVTNKGIKDIGGKYYDLYLTRLCKLNKGNPRNALFWVFLIIFGMSVTLWNISTNTSRINKSIAAKLWVTLLIVAVIPVVTVFFVFGLFRSEYYFIKTSFERAKMQRFGELFEQKYKFSSPLVWNIIKTNNDSLELKKYITALNTGAESDINHSESFKNIKNLINNWSNEIELLDKEEKKLNNISVENIFVAGFNGWKALLKDDNEFNSLLEEFPGLLFNVENSHTSAEVVKQNHSLSLSKIKNILGDDKYISLVQTLNKPVYLQLKGNTYGFYTSIVNPEKPQGLIIWIVKYNDFTYLKSLAKELDSSYTINISEKQRYGDIYNYKNNHWRIYLGKFANWISTSNIPVSDFLKFVNRQWFLIEGKPFLQNQNSILLLITPEKDVLYEIVLLSIYFYILLGISLLIIIHNTRSIADDIVNPINSLIAGIREVNKENLSYRINSDRTDELGALCSSFDIMVKGLNEKRLMSHMLSNTARMVALKEEKISVGKSKSVLLYVGIPDFSSYRKEKNDNEIFSSLNVQTSEIAGIIMKEGGEVDKIIGERLLAVFKVKDNNEFEVAELACNAAKNIIELEKTKKLPFSVAIGINYGEVINGFLGIGNKRDFTVIGDAVNVSARIESLAEKLTESRCLLSNTFYELINGSIKTEYYGEVELKGKSQPMKVYKLL